VGWTRRVATRIKPESWCELSSASPHVTSGVNNHDNSLPAAHFNLNLNLNHADDFMITTSDVSTEGPKTPAPERRLHG